MTDKYDAFMREAFGIDPESYHDGQPRNGDADGSSHPLSAEDSGYDAYVSLNAEPAAAEAAAPAAEPPAAAARPAVAEVSAPAAEPPAAAAEPPGAPDSGYDAYVSLNAEPAAAEAPAPAAEPPAAAAQPAVAGAPAPVAEPPAAAAEPPGAPDSGYDAYVSLNAEPAAAEAAAPAAEPPAAAAQPAVAEAPAAAAEPPGAPDSGYDVYVSLNAEPAAAEAAAPAAEPPAAAAQPAVAEAPAPVADPPAAAAEPPGAPDSGYNAYVSLNAEPAAAEAGAPAAGPAAPKRPAARKHKPVDTTASPSGMKSKRVSDDYDGEHNQAGWRGKLWNQDADDSRITTKLFTPEEQAAGTLRMNKDGSFKTGDGGSLAARKRGYVMDDTGRVVTFKDDLTTGRTDESGARVEQSGAFSKARLGPALAAVKADPTATVQTTHHSSALGEEPPPPPQLDDNGQPVAQPTDSRGRPIKKSRAAAAAGEMSFDVKGKIIRITNSSGHYKPGVDFLIQAVEQLSKQGAFFADEVTGPDGAPLAPDSKPMQLYSSTQQQLENAKNLAAEAAKLTENLAAAEDDAKPAIAERLTALTDQIQALSPKIETAQKTLRKLGVAPSMRTRTRAKVEFFDVADADKLSGQEVRALPQQEQGVEEFLRSGGNAKGGGVKAAKDRMQAELLEKTAGRRAEADRNTIGGGPAEPAPTEEQIDAAIAGVRPPPA